MEKKQAIAIAKTQRVAPRKARLVADQVRGKNLADAINTLGLIDKKSTSIILKLINSAAANAQNNHDMEVEKLFVAKIIVNEGPTIKRFRPRAQGRASSIFKRTSHITVWLEERAAASADTNSKASAPKGGAAASADTNSKASAPKGKVATTKKANDKVEVKKESKEG